MNKYFIPLFLVYTFTFSGCKLLEAECQTIKYLYGADKAKIVRPNFIDSSSILQEVTIDRTKKYFWIEYSGLDSNMYSHRFNIYNINGKLLGRYYYYLIDLSKYKSVNSFFKEFIKHPFYKSILNKSFKLEAGKKGKQYLLLDGKRFLMREYLPRDMEPDNKKRKMYYEWQIPNLLPNHAVMVEDIDTDFLYKWRVLTSSVLLPNGKTQIYVLEYDYEGKPINDFSFDININDQINYKNYSFLRDLFFNEQIFINNGEYYTMDFN